jgi:hypothetical protein
VVRFCKFAFVVVRDRWWGKYTRTRTQDKDTKPWQRQERDKDETRRPHGKDKTAGKEKARLPLVQVMAWCTSSLGAGGEMFKLDFVFVF